jgi:hypothetical protein
MSKPFLSLAMAGSLEQSAHTKMSSTTRVQLVSLLAGLNVAPTQRQSTETYTDPILMVMN